MIRIKIANENKVDLANTEDIELLKKTRSINDTIIYEFYNNVRNTLRSKKTNLEKSLTEISVVLSTIINDEAVALKIVDYLYKNNSVTEFNDLKRLSSNEIFVAFRKNTNLSEEEIAKHIKSLAASLA